jgi:hypothetical protein
MSWINKIKQEAIFRIENFILVNENEKISNIIDKVLYLLKLKQYNIEKNKGNK